ncbi:hypothetical protein AAY473_014004 [Plecturocebus cupreus]
MSHRGRQAGPAGCCEDLAPSLICPICKTKRLSLLHGNPVSTSLTCESGHRVSITVLTFLCGQAHGTSDGPGQCQL